MFVRLSENVTILTSSLLKDHPDCDVVLKEMFGTDFIGIVVDYSDPHDFDFTKDLIFNSNCYGLEVEGRLVAFAETYANRLGKVLNIFVPIEHGRKGYAVMLSKWLIENNVIDTWVAARRNEPSNHLAVKLGLHLDNSNLYAKDNVYRV